MNMKKNLLVVICFVMSIFVNAQQSDFKVGDFAYRVLDNANDVELVASVPVSSANIPSLVTYNDQTYRVKSIGDGVFSRCDYLYHVNIPEGVEHIGESAFERCNMLTSIVLPMSLKSVGTNAFYKAVNLSQVVVQSELLQVGPFAFSLIGMRVPLYSHGVFLYMPQNYKGDYVMPDGIHTIVGGAFERCEGLTGLVLPESMRTIGVYAFKRCEGLKAINIPAGMETIGEMAFGDCYNLQPINHSRLKLQLPQNEEVGYEPVDWNSSMEEAAEEVVWDDSAIEVAGGDDFAEEVAWEEGSAVEDVWWGEEAGAEYETEVTMTLNDVEYYLDCVQGFAVLLKGVNRQEVEIPAFIQYRGKEFPVVAIGDEAFAYCDLLETIVIPEGVEAILNGAFQRCDGLVSLKLPETLKIIGNMAFFKSHNLTEMNIPDGVRCIGVFAFDRTQLPEPICRDGVFYYLPRLHDGAYVIPDGIHTIADGAFDGCFSLTAVTIPETVTSIGARAFHVCSSLETINIPESVVYIGEEAFAGAGLTSVSMPTSVTGLLDETFSNCSSLTEITLPEGLVFIGNRMFAYCYSLTHLTIPSTVQHIGAYLHTGIDDIEVTNLSNQPIEDPAGW